MVRTCTIAILALTLAGAPAANADTILSITSTGSVAFSPGCPPPPSPPFDCPLTATGTAVDATGTFGPWNFSSPFTLFSADPVSATVFRNGGTFHYDDPSPANNDFFGTFTGQIDLATFSSIHTYFITGGSGAFAGASGFGTGSVQVNPLDFTYIETARFLIPLPSTLALLAIAVVAFAGSAARKRR
jgi:hypothetical protein